MMKAVAPALALLTLFAATPGGAAPADLYPEVAEVGHATPQVVQTLRNFFVAKSAHRPAEMMTHFSKNGVLYIDATSGGIWPSWDSLNTIFSTMMPKMVPAALSYPVRIYGNRKSALVFFTDTPELFGREMRILGSVSFDDKGRIIRWMDYWDGRSAPAKLTIGPKYPTDFHDEVGNATGRIAEVSNTLEAALAAGDAKAAAALFSNDAVFEDMALHGQILGRLAIGRYLTRALPKAPYGPGASVAHVVGSDLGGGYEWKAAAGFPQRRGTTGLALDKAGRITRLTVVYDSSLFSDGDYRERVALLAEP